MKAQTIPTLSTAAREELVALLDSIAPDAHGPVELTIWYSANDGCWKVG